MFKWIKQYCSKNPILFVLIFVFVILNLIDIISAMFILPGEANPIFLLTGSLAPVFILKILMMCIAIWIYSKNVFPTNFQYFFIITILVLGNVLLLLGVGSNVYGMMNPQVIEQASTLSAQEKMNYYWQLSFLFYFIPMAFNLLSFKLYEKSLKKITFKKEENFIVRWFRRRQT